MRKTCREFGRSTSRHQKSHARYGALLLLLLLRTSWWTLCLFPPTKRYFLFLFLSFFSFAGCIIQKTVASFVSGCCCLAFFRAPVVNGHLSVLTATTSQPFPSSTVFFHESFRPTARRRSQATACSVQKRRTIYKTTHTHTQAGPLRMLGCHADESSKGEKGLHVGTSVRSARFSHEAPPLDIHFVFTFSHVCHPSSSLTCDNRKEKKRVRPFPPTAWRCVTPP